MTRKPRRNTPDTEGAQQGSGAGSETARETRSEAPAAKKPAAKKAAAKKPAAKKPAAEKPAAKKTAAEKTAAEKTAAEKTAAEKTAAEKTAAEKTAAEKTTATKAAGQTAAGDQAAKKTAEKSDKLSLPAFGFAADLLSRSDAGKGADRKAADGEDAKPAPAIDESDPRRIFQFADSLEAGAAEQQVAAPVRLETWVAFSLAGEVFALPVAPIREVVRVSSITRVPHAPKPIRGVTNRRGRVIPVIDLRMRIELPAADLERASRVIVVSSRRRLLGLLVDAVHQVVHIDLDKVQPPPDDVMTVQSDYLSGVYHLDDQLILLLDVDRALIIQGPAAQPAGGPETAAEAGTDASTGLI